jgi:hypothetical protein
MKRSTASFFSTFILILSLACSPGQVGNYRDALDGQPNRVLSGHEKSTVSFEDKTAEVLGHAERLIENNEKEGAVLDQRWYTLKRFGNHQDAIFSASQVIFYGGSENAVRTYSGNRYTSILPLENDRDPGDIRLFIGKRAAQHDLIIVGQNGKEVALKTIIRLLYLAKFVDDERKRKYGDKLRAFRKSLKVLMSSLGARQEFIGFFNKHAISNPDAVMIGFIGDIRSLIRDEGIADPELYSDESLRVNWYTNASGMRVLLVSIDHNRIFSSRAGELIEAIFTVSPNTTPSVTFLGSGGAIDEPGIVGKIVRPTVVIKGDPFPAIRHRGVLVHLIRNKALEGAAIKTAHASVESVVVETTQWAIKMKRDRIRTVDQELFHIVDAINSSANARAVEVFAGILVTDNVSSNVEANVDATLEYAEETIARAAGVRREFFSDVLTKLGVLKRGKTTLPSQKEIAF